MKKFLMFLLAGFMTAALTACGGNSRADSAPSPAPAGPHKILVAYFSATGTTKGVAETLAAACGADLVAISPEEPYTEEDLNYHNDSCRANREQHDPTARPAIAGRIENWDSYDVVLVGYPIWWGEEPRVIDTFMESYDFSGKSLANFCTSGGSGVSASTDKLKALAPAARWLGDKRFSAGASASDAKAWLSALGL